MAKKKAVAFNRTEALEAIDSELDAAMEQLDDSNVRITDILEGYEAELHPPDAGDADSSSDEADGADSSEGGTPPAEEGASPFGPDQSPPKEEVQPKDAESVSGS